MIEMKEEIKKRWIEALCSGKFKKGEGHLYNSDTGAHCALGVLCELAVEEGVVERYDLEQGGPSMYGNFGRDKNDSILPRAVVEWAGLESPSPLVSFRDSVYDDTTAYTVSELNDLGASFDAIADKLEAEE